MAEFQQNPRERRNARLMRLWTAMVLFILYLPLVAIVLASFSSIRFFMFPIQQWSLRWYEAVLGSMELRDHLGTSLSIAVLVTLISVVMGVFGALAFARYPWRGRRLYQRFILLPIFFPQAVLGLALLLWYSALGITPNWQTAVFAHLVWIVPIVTLIISIRVYGFDPALEEAARDLGATRAQVFREVTLPVLWPGIFSGGLFAFLLSWGNLPLSVYTSGADQTIPEWLYSRMIAGYTPQVPALGVLLILVAATVLFGGYALLRWRARRRDGQPATI
ncbi:spermidine/putrescine transport system permease protein [Alkalispirillum mobile]|uniref:Spermidine/putrescine transport system permease protein n=1 Tax=Alkalispirillum mobile TaxID=85925 RepID=A0A498C737_9GAMM|nr:ABC transporter permease [Alkalispirillum mobile]RLK51562.1 spermidine/putrescine transport system permease protein [Alkalispirillum mobile]